MIEAPVRNFLRALRRAIRQVRLYPAGHPLTEEAIKDSGRAVEELTEFEGEIVITLHEDAFYLNRSLLPHTSLEFNGLLREMQDRAIDSVTVIRPVSREDMYDLANFIAGEGDDLPAGGTVRLNERSVGFELEVSPMSKLRGSYAGSLDALRAISGSLATDSGFELGRVVSAVEGIFEHSISHSGAALLLSTVKSHDEYTFYHSVNTCILSLAMGRLVGLEKEQLLPIGVGALLHDIGKVAVSARVLQSPGRLNEEQWKEIQLQPQEGAQAIMAAAGVGHEISATIAFEHHARFDGKGYPTVTRAGKPHVFSRLVSVADTYDAGHHQTLLSQGGNTEQGTERAAQRCGLKLRPRSGHRVHSDDGGVSTRLHPRAQRRRNRDGDAPARRRRSQATGRDGQVGDRRIHRA